MGILKISDGFIYLDNQKIDGILVGSDVGTSIIFDDTSLLGKDGKVPIPLGWDDASISFNLALLTDETLTCYDRLRRLNSIFRKVDKDGNPVVYSISNRHLRSRGIKSVVFSELSSSESNENDVISASLVLKEFSSPSEKNKRGVDAGVLPVSISNTGAENVPPSISTSTNDLLDDNGEINADSLNESLE